MGVEQPKTYELAQQYTLDGQLNEIVPGGAGVGSVCVGMNHPTKRLLP